MATSPLPASSPIDVTALATLADTLAALLERETGLVRTLKITEIAPLQAEKTRLTQHFQVALKTLAAAGGSAALAGAAKARWLQSGRRLAAAAIENERALRVGRIATERLIAAIVAAVRLSRKPPTAYSARNATRRPAQIAGIALNHLL